MEAENPLSQEKGVGSIAGAEQLAVSPRNPTIGVSVSTLFEVGLKTKTESGACPECVGGAFGEL